MPIPTFMHVVSCTHRALASPDDNPEEPAPHRAIFGLVHDELLADVLTGYLNTMTEDDCPRLRGLADWKVNHQLVRVFTIGQEQDFADALVGRAFEWFQLGQAA